MFKFGGGKMTTDKIFFQKFFRRGGKWQRGENDRGYYGNSIVYLTIIKIINQGVKTKVSEIGDE